MKSLIYLLLCVLTALLTIAIALLAQQNATPVSLTLLTARSIDVPLGLMLTIALAIGLVTPPLFLFRLKS